MPQACLLDVIRAKVLGLLPFPDEAGLPVQALLGLELRQLLALLFVLSECRRAVEGDAVNKDSSVIVADAAHVLSEWPENYFELLAALGSRTLEKGNDIRTQFAPLYNSFLKLGSGPGVQASKFLRLAFLDFVSNHWGRRVADAKLMKNLQGHVSKRFVTRAELARSIGVHIRTVSRLTSVSENPCGHDQIVIDSSSFTMDSSENRRLLNAREAAATIGIPVSVLRALKKAGFYEVKHIIPG